mgnify:CR=1 FL=1
MTEVKASPRDVEARMHPVDPAWLGKTVEPVIEPDLPIVDPHHHLWDFRNYPYLLEGILADVGSGHNVRATVFIECSAMWTRAGDVPDPMRPVGEVAFVNGIAAMSASGRYGDVRVAAGIVGHADLMLGSAVQDVLAAQVRAGNGRFRGIRYSISHDDAPEIHNSHTGGAPDAFRQSAFRDGYRTLGRMGLSFEAWMYHPQLRELAALVEACPDTAVVLNHCGGPLGIGPYAGKRDAVFRDWKAGIEAVAKAGPAHVKLGGIGMTINGFDFQTRAAPASSTELADHWRPYIDACIEAFGPERCMFESNFPVDKISGSYRTYWNAFKRLASGASAAEKAAMFHDVAKRFYKL